MGRVVSGTTKASALETCPLLHRVLPITESSCSVRGKQPAQDFQILDNIWILKLYERKNTSFQSMMLGLKTPLVWLPGGSPRATGCLGVCISLQWNALHGICSTSSPATSEEPMFLLCNDFLSRKRHTASWKGRLMGHPWQHVGASHKTRRYWKLWYEHGTKKDLPKILESPATATAETAAHPDTRAWEPKT